MGQTVNGDGMTLKPGTRNGADGDVVAAANHALDPEVVARPQRRTFTAEEKLRILEAAEACKHGELGALLRREGLTYSTLRDWREARDKAVAKALEYKKRGPSAKDPEELEQKLAKALEEAAHYKKEAARLNKELERAKIIIDVQKKVSELLAQGSKDDSGETP